MRHAAGELADRLQLLRLPQQLFRLPAGFVFGLQLASSILDGVFQRFRKGAQLRGGTLLVGDVDADPDDPNRLSGLVVKDEAPRQNQRNSPSFGRTMRKSSSNSRCFAARAFWIVARSRT